MDPVAEKSCLKRLKTFSPKIGISTIKNEKRATASFLTPNNKPTAIVDPDREIPGITATVCAIPIIKASLNETSLSLDLA